MFLIFLLKLKNQNSKINSFELFNDLKWQCTGTLDETKNKQRWSKADIYSPLDNDSGEIVMGKIVAVCESRMNHVIWLVFDVFLCTL